MCVNSFLAHYQLLLFILLFTVICDTPQVYLKLNSVQGGAMSIVDTIANPLNPTL